MVIEICIGSACHLKGSHQIVRKLQQLVADNALEEQVVLKSSFCLGQCAGAVSVRVDGERHFSLTPEDVDQFYHNEIYEVVQREIHSI